MIARSRSHARGTTLLEGMAAIAILTIGILGAMQALLAASQQNVTAGRMARAAQVADQVRHGLETQRFNNIVGAGRLYNPSGCTSSAAAQAASGALATLIVTAPTVGPCYIDLDAWEAAQLATPNRLIAPGFTPADGNPVTRDDGDLFRRVLVVTHQPGSGTVPALVTMTVVVSFRGTGLQRLTVQQTTALYDPAGSQTGVDIL